MENDVKAKKSENDLKAKKFGISSSHLMALKIGLF